ncbi:hypothetical protein ZWY2020_005000 [Hordeum vulgare]|nr:hypothetical protein ZWY2020_005000 [Hordeum vulgare]
MEPGAHPPCAACGDDAHAACRACSYALCRACLDEDVAEGRAACARCGGEYAVSDPAHAKGSAMEEEEEEAAVEDQLAAEGLRGRVTMANQLSDRQDEVSHARTLSSMSGVGSELNDESGKPIWKNRVDSWKEKKNEKKASAKKAAAKAQVPPVEEQIMEEKDLTDAYGDGEDSGLAPVDFFVSTVDPLKEPPLITANTVLSILAVDYPVEKISCYVSDDGSAMLTFESLAETAEFARRWVPFCKKFSIEPRTPEFYFSQKIDYLKDKIHPSFVKERRAMKRDYEEFKVRINALVAKAQKTPEEGWVMQDGTPWPGNNSRDHPGMIQVFLGETGARDFDGNELPRLVYVSREKRPGYQHHKKAGAMSALRCLLCPVPQRFDGIDRSDRYANRNVVFFDVNMKGLDGIHGPVYVGTGGCFYSQALYVLVFIESTLMENGGVPESLGWIYGSVTEDILTGFKMHCRGWRSIYCMPIRPAFKGSAPINLSDRLHQRHCPLWYSSGGGRLRWLQRLSYINTIVYPFTSVPLAYCCLPAICLLTGKFIIPILSNAATIWFLGLFTSIILTSVLELRWSGIGIEDWWRNEQFWVIGGVSAHLFAVFQGILKMVIGLDTNFTVTSKAAEDGDFAELYVFKWTTVLIPPTTILVLNLVGVVAGFSDALNSGYESWGPLFGKVFFSMWVIMHLYPFLKGLMGRQNRTPTIVILWSVLLASVFSLLWVKIDPFISGAETVATGACSSIDC